MQVFFFFLLLLKEALQEKTSEGVGDASSQLQPEV